MDALQQGLFRSMQELWIQPEIDRRLSEGSIQPDFVVSRCLVRLPEGKLPIVEFNEEVTIHAIVKVPDGIHPNPGEPVGLDQIERIGRIDPPLYNGQRVAWAYLHWVHGNPELFQDLSANSPDIPLDRDVQMGLQLGIGSVLHDSLIELTIAEYSSSQSEFNKIGLWAVPALLPYPLSKICSLLKTDQVDKACTLLIDHCSVERLTKIMANWWDTPEFALRRPLLEQGFAAHAAGQYFLSVSTLIPHIEGVIVDWLFANTPSMPTQQKQRINAFRQEFLKLVAAKPMHQNVVRSTFDFIEKGPVMAAFKSWDDPVEDTFANRHVVGHGKFNPDVYTKDNSIKAILMLDTIRQLIPPIT